MTLIKCTEYQKLLEYSINNVEQINEAIFKLGDIYEG
jgi:hypothetical protein